MGRYTAIRKSLRRKYNNTCCYCECILSDDLNCNEGATIEHILAKEAGGSGRISNLEVACRLCNRAKGILETVLWINIHPKAFRAFLLNVGRNAIIVKKKRSGHLRKSFMGFLLLNSEYVESLGIRLLKGKRAKLDILIRGSCRIGQIDMKD